MSQTQPTQPERFEIKIKPASDNALSITVDGTESTADGFEFSAPSGSGMAVRHIMRIELVPNAR